MFLILENDATWEMLEVSDFRIQHFEFVESVEKGLGDGRYGL